MYALPAATTTDPLAEAAQAFTDQKGDDDGLLFHARSLLYDWITFRLPFQVSSIVQLHILVAEYAFKGRERDGSPDAGSTVKNNLLLRSYAIGSGDGREFGGIFESPGLGQQVCEIDVYRAVDVTFTVLC